MRQLVVIRGPICSGKSTITVLLREHFKEASRVDFDVLKLQIDDTASSLWRQKLALKTAAFLTNELMKLGRTIIVDIHSSKEDQYLIYKKLAEKNGYQFFSFLLQPPLAVCIERNRVYESTLKYKITYRKIKEYYANTFTVPGEKKFDTSLLSPEEVALEIFRTVRPT